MNVNPPPDAVDRSNLRSRKLKTVLFGAGLGLVVSTTAAGQVRSVLLGNWRDCEIRTGQAGLSLGLVPTAPHGQPTVVLSAASSQGSQPPANVGIEAAVGQKVNPNFVRSRTLAFMVNPGGPSQKTIDLSSRLRFVDRAPGTAIDDGSATLTWAEFQEVLKGSAVTLKVFGIDCPLSPRELDALRSFAARVSGSGNRR